MALTPTGPLPILSGPTERCKITKEQEEGQGGDPELGWRSELSLGAFPGLACWDPCPI